MSCDEDGAGWLAFLRSLTAQGLSGVRLVVSDAHRGLVNSIGAALPGAQWQRCRTHYLRNLLSRVPKSAQPWVATLVRTIFDQPDAVAVSEQFERVLDTIAEKFPAAAEHLDDARGDLLAFTAFPRELWRAVGAVSLSVAAREVPPVAGPPRNNRWWAAPVPAGQPTCAHACGFDGSPLVEVPVVIGLMLPDGCACRSRDEDSSVSVPVTPGGTSLGEVRLCCLDSGLSNHAWCWRPGLPLWP